MTVKEVIEYIISESKKDESLLTDTKRFWAYLSDLAPEHRKELKVIKRSLDSEFLTLCFKDKEDIKRRVFKMKFRLEEQGVGENWIDFIIESFFTPLGWKPPQDEEETSQTQNQQIQKQQIQKQQIQKQQIQNQQTQNQQTQNQQTQNQQTQNQQTQKQQTQNQQTQKQQRQNQQIQKQQTQKQQIQSQQRQNQQTQYQQTQNQQIQKQQIQKQQTQKQQTQNQQTQNQQTQNQQNGGTRWYVAILIFVGIFILAIISNNSNTNVGDYIKFGSYPQTAEGQEQPIEWQVLARENNKILVISRYGLDTKRFDGGSNDWKNSGIRNWLNGDFYNNAFSDSEKKYINLSNLSDVGTTDNVFLLSKEEVEKYFSNNAERRCKATDYAVKNGAWVDIDNDRGNGYSVWWLRSPRPRLSNYVYDVDSDGCVFNRIIDFTSDLVRPALWINLNKEAVTYSTIETTNKSYNQTEKIETKEITLANVGDYIKFGNYPQTSRGQEQPIEWQVLSKENNKILVISRYGLNAKRFDGSSNVWANSEIRKWLNGDFYNNAFSDSEKKYINSSYLSDVGTTDNVFLLSKEEAEKYFVNNDARRCKATDYAVKNGAYVWKDNGCGVWWLRSLYLDGVYIVRSGGYVNFCSLVSSGDGLARPALWINL